MERRGGEKDGEKAERRRKSLLSAETERHAGTKWAGHWEFLEALPNPHICCLRVKWANALDSETDSQKPRRSQGRGEGAGWPGEAPPGFSKMQSKQRRTVKLGRALGRSL